MNAPAHLRRKPDEDLRYFGFSLSPATAQMMEAKMRRRRLREISEYIERLVIADVVKDAEVRS